MNEMTPTEAMAAIRKAASVCDCKGTGELVIRGTTVLALEDWNGDDGEIDWCDCPIGERLRAEEEAQ